VFITVRLVVRLHTLAPRPHRSGQVKVVLRTTTTG
jgi:hypothetical protein